MKAWAFFATRDEIFEDGLSECLVVGKKQTCRDFAAIHRTKKSRIVRVEIRELPKKKASRKK